MSDFALSEPEETPVPEPKLLPEPTPTVLRPATPSAVTAAPGKPVTSSSVILPAPAVPGLPAAPRVKAKTKKGRKSPLTQEFWRELRNFYESGDYTQRALVNYARSRGVTISQARISKKAIEEGWIKGKDRARIEAEEKAKLQGHLGETLRTMLERHTQMARGLQAEILIHVQQIQRDREANPHAKLAPNALATIVAALDKAQCMEARAIGFDYDKGKPFGAKDPTDEDAGALKPLTVRELTPEEEAAVRVQAEKETGGGAEEEAEE